MKNKILIIAIAVISIALVVLLEVKFNFTDSAKKLKADITYPTENGLAFSCDKTTIAVDEQIECKLVGHFSGGVDSIEGIFEKNEYLNMGTILINTPPFEKIGNAYITESTTEENFIVATVSVTGVSEGTGMLKFIGDPDGDDATVDKVKVVYDNVNSETTLDDAIINITVSNSSTPSTPDEPTEPDEPSEPLSSVSTLSSLTIAPATLNETFRSDKYDYTAVVANEVSSITIAATKTDSKSTIVEAESDLGVKQLTVGENYFEITVKSEDESEVRTYSIDITRQAPIVPDKSSDNNLKGLTITGITLSPAFNASTIEYNATVENNVTSITVNATKNDDKANVSISGNDNLAVGANTVTIKVTAENNSVKTYTIIVTRKSADNTPTCELELVSTVYKVDNVKSILDAVNQDDTIETIKKNVSSKCGTIEVTSDKVILTNGGQVRTYKINRVFVPKTGQNPVKYIAIIGGIIVIIGLLIFIKKKMDK